MTDIITRYNKLRNTLKSDLRGRGWHRAIKCINFAEQQHTGLRKDGVTPEYMHQIEIALFALTMVSFFKFPEETICAILLHDTPEDTDIDWSTIKQKIVGALPEQFGNKTNDVEFADRVLFSVENLTKVYRGSKKPFAVYMENMSRDPIASIGKLLDRDHNLSTMLGVFTVDKIFEQCDESEQILAMGKIAQELFSEQHEAYEILKKSIKEKIKMLRQYATIAKASGLEK